MHLFKGIAIATFAIIALCMLLTVAQGKCQVGCTCGDPNCNCGEGSDCATQSNSAKYCPDYCLGFSTNSEWDKTSTYPDCRCVCKEGYTWNPYRNDPFNKYITGSTQAANNWCITIEEAQRI